MPGIRFWPDEIRIEIEPEQTLLEAALRHGIPHAHACEGRARCSTCRVRVLEGLSHCRPRNPAEQALAERLGFDSPIRLACQTQVTGDVTVRRLVLDADDVALTSQFPAREEPGPVGEEKRIAILFADIRGFTAFADALLPYDVVHVLNRYFHLMGQAIARHEGHVDNYMGDGLLALFGLEDPQSGPWQAVQAGWAMLAALETLHPYLQAVYGRSFEIGIGVHVGDAVVGRIGAAGRKRVTAIGDAVNVASRIETANKRAGTRFLISQDTYAPVSERLRVGKRVRLGLPGKPGRYPLYEVLGIQQEPVPTGPA